MNHSEMPGEALWSRARFLENVPQSEGRVLSLGEGRELDAIYLEIDKRTRLTEAPRQQASSLQRSQPSGNFGNPPPTTAAYFDRDTGQWVRAKSHGERMFDGQPDDAPSLGGMIIGAATGRWMGMEREKAAVVGSQDASGGFLVPQYTAGNVIDLARARSVLSAAGMKTIQFPENADTLKIGRVATDPTAYWRVEGGAISASNPTFEQLVLTPKVLAVLVPVSIEFLSDVSNAQQMLTDVISRAMAAEIDRAILYGTGAAAEPSGLATMDNVTKVTGVGSWNIDWIINRLETIWTNNGPTDGLSMLLHPDGESYRLRLVDGNGEYLFTKDNPVSNVRYLVSTNVTSTDTFIGDFSRVLLAVKDQLRVEVLPAGTGTTAAGTTYNATSEMYRWVRVYARLDSHCEYPKHLVYASGLTNT